ncbi:hypothetical protein [Miltoncostaea oceani]|uniref:hypothetical protein n=1 Tax=Miltoncostaea oceani TaxID=2843216 RepID=UPI001C3C6DB9|nr:hypothetical protein [Miltoncostaea oceani]
MIAIAVGVSATSAVGASFTIIPSTPVAEIATTFGADVQSDAQSWLHVKYRPAGGAGCAPSPEADPGSYLVNNVRGTGARRISVLETFSSAGTYLLCGWLRDADFNVLAAQTGTLVVRAPLANVVMTAPALAPLRRAFVVTFSGQTEAPRYLYVAYRAAGGAPCAPTPASETGTWIASGDRVEGAFSFPKTVTLDTLGNFMVCGWLASNQDDLAPLARFETKLTNVRPTVASAPAALTKVGVSGRRLSTGIRLPTAGALVVRLVGKGRRITLASVRVTGPRTVRVGYRRPARVPRGRYVLEVRFLSAGATVGSVVRRSVAFR